MQKTKKSFVDETGRLGFPNATTVDKAEMVKGVFESVSPRYDLMNDLMSLGMHRVWKRSLINELSPIPGMRLLDVGCGTGDVALRFLARGGSHVWACDNNKKMIDIGRSRAINNGVISGVKWIVGDAESLPLDDTSVDAYTIAFGLRNVTKIELALAEALRVLEPGGRFLCLEFAPSAAPWLAPLYDLYSINALPAIGAFVTGDRDAYRYLVESIRLFPDQTELSERITAAGFHAVKHRCMTGGIVTIHSAWRI